MVITVYNVSSSTARVSWPSAPSCLDSFYSVMYDPNWNSLLMGYKRKSFMHEERIPVSHTSAYLANLLPQTAYFLCVTCQAANPVKDQCQVFSTLSGSSEGHDRAGWQLAMGVWLTSCLLLLVIAGILLWGCLRTICSVPTQDADGCPSATAARPDVSASGRLYAPDSLTDSSITGSPLLSARTRGHIITHDHEARMLAKLSGSQPV
ncbi:fibronectin type III domain-containing protein 9 [Genypterus blacodes]|uniref:fibronectin type III domain-containing protein 9 n=1 Tax=Genypterus blacodes TaxID=154954 RepID=UPI003F767282